MLQRTIDQKPDANSFPKAGELIDVRGIGQLSLHDRRVFNLLYAAAGQRICDDIDHIVPIAELRGSHKGGERVKDSVVALMRTVVEVPVKGRDGKPATKLVPLLSDTTICDDDDNPTGEVVFSLSKGMRAIIKDSTHWGRVRGAVMFAFTSKYALALYELVCKRVGLKHIWQEEFSIEDFRALLGVPDGKLLNSTHLLQKVIQPAELEVNGLADFGVKVEELRRGGNVRGKLTGFRLSWWRKDVPGLKDAYSELNKAKVGRMARLRGQLEEVEPIQLPELAGQWTKENKT